MYPLTKRITEYIIKKAKNKAQTASSRSYPPCFILATAQFPRRERDKWNHFLERHRTPDANSLNYCNSVQHVRVQWHRLNGLMRMRGMVIITTGIKWRCLFVCLLRKKYYYYSVGWFPHDRQWDGTWCDSALQSAYDYNQTAGINEVEEIDSGLEYESGMDRETDRERER